MKIDRLKDTGIWVVIQENDGQLPTILDVFHTKKEAQEYIKGNKPSLLSRFKLHFER